MTKLKICGYCNDETSEPIGYHPHCRMIADSAALAAKREVFSDILFILDDTQDSNRWCAGCGEDLTIEIIKLKQKHLANEGGVEKDGS